MIVEPGGTGAVAHVGLHALGSIADRLGLDDSLSARSPLTGERLPVHDRRKVLMHDALMLAGGGEAVRTSTMDWSPPPPSLRPTHRTDPPVFPIHAAFPGAFDPDDFIIDHDNRTATCPAGYTVPIAFRGSTTFGRRYRDCLQRARCTKSRPEGILQLPPHDAELVDSRRAWREGDSAEDYRRWRPMAGRSIAWLVADNHRRVRFRGVEKNQLGLSLRIAAINLRRLVNLGLRHDGTWQVSAV